MVDGIVRSDGALVRSLIERVQWKTVQTIPPGDPRFTIEMLEQRVADKTRSAANRARPAYTLALLRRVKKGIPIVISALHINDTRLLQLPGECFIQDQLRAQQIGGSSQFVATATYGDQGPWYVPIREEYSHGGYEVSIAFCGPKMDHLLTRAMKSCLV